MTMNEMRKILNPKFVLSPIGICLIDKLLKCDLEDMDKWTMELIQDTHRLDWSRKIEFNCLLREHQNELNIEYDKIEDLITFKEL